MSILDDICIAKTKGIAAKDVAETGKYPVFGATGLMGYLDTYESENEYVGIIKDGAGVGRTNIYPAKSSLLGTMQYIFPKENIDIKYLMYLLRSLNLGGAAAGAAIPHIYFKNYKKSVVPECNFEKQKLISKLLEKIENLIKLKQKQIFSLDELVKSRFIEMFENKNFEEKKWFDVVNIINGKDYKKIPNISGTYPIYGSGGYMGIRCDQYLCNENSVIIGRKGNVTNPIFVKEKYWNVDTAFGIETKDCLNPYYFYYHTLTVDLSSLVSGAAIPSMTKTSLQKIKIIVPPIELQNTFAEFVKQVDKSKFIVQKQIEDLQELLDSKMDEYFGV